MKYPSRHRIFCGLLVLGFAACAAAQSKAPAPMAQEARENAWRPIRADVLPQSQGAKTGETVPLRVVLLDAYGKPTNATQDTSLVVQAVGPSGKVDTIEAHVPAGSSSTEVNFQATQPGLTKLTVSHPDERVVGSSNYVLITPEKSSAQPKTAPAKKAVKKKDSGQSPTSILRLPFSKGRLHAVNLVTYNSQDDPQAGTGGGPAVAGPRIMLQVSGDHDSDVRADNTNFERVDIYYMDTHPPNSTIKVWLSWDHGAINPNPLVIGKGQYVGESHWTSGSQVKNATVTIADVQPKLAIKGAASASVNFVEPVMGVAFFNPPTTMSIVDESDLHARFYDIAGNFVQTADKRNVAVSTSSPIVKFTPSAQDTNWDFATNVTPIGWGTAKIQVATPGYPPFTHTLVITYLGVVLLCIGGGLLGSLGDIVTNRETAHGWRIPARLMVGSLAALLACWAYVIIGFPEVPSGLLHSRIAVVGVSLVGGWAGILAVRRVAKLLGMEI